MYGEQLTKPIEKPTLNKSGYSIGFIPVERFDELPKKCGSKPKFLYPVPKNVIAMTKSFPNACMEMTPMHDNNDPEVGNIGDINTRGSLKNIMISNRRMK